MSAARAALRTTSRKKFMDESPFPPLVPPAGETLHKNRSLHGSAQARRYSGSSVPNVNKASKEGSERLMVAPLASVATAVASRNQNSGVALTKKRGRLRTGTKCKPAYVPNVTPESVVFPAKFWPLTRAQPSARPASRSRLERPARTRRNGPAKSGQRVQRTSPLPSASVRAPNQLALTQIPKPRPAGSQAAFSARAGARFALLATPPRPAPNTQ